MKHPCGYGITLCIVLFSLLSCEMAVNTPEGNNAVDHKILPLVMHDQWDLIIDSDDDLAALASGNTQYQFVLITNGTYAISDSIDLDAHGVIVFTGIDKHTVTLNVDFDFGTDSVITASQSLSYFGNMAIQYTHDTAPSSCYGSVLDVSDANDVEIENVHIMGFCDSSYGIKGTSGNSTDQCGETILQNVHVDDCYTAYYNLMRLENCVAYSSGSHGFSNCIYIGTCFSTYNDGDGFHECEIIANTRSTDNDGSGFYGGEHRLGRITGSFSDDNTYGYNSCRYVASSTALGNEIDWHDCTSIDAYSTNHME
jgi:hypothetical protein